MAVSIPSRLSFSGSVRPGAMVEVRWIVGHPMETGFRVDESGRRVLRNVITLVRVLVNDRVVLELEPATGIAANPYFAFPLKVPEQGGHVRVEWLDDAGNRGSVQQLLLLQP